MTTANYETDLEHALHLADTADVISMRHYRANDLIVQQKPDLTPVTQADTEVEQALSRIVTTEYGESYLGEEGTRQGSNERRWIVDPIDGTKNYLRHMLIWATLIGLSVDNQTVAAVVSAPALGRRWWATQGGGAYTRDPDGFVRQLQVSQVSEPADAFLLTSSFASWDTVATGQERVRQLIERVWRWRAPGDFLNYMLIAEGAADMCAEPNPKQWDIEAPGLIVTEAGGKLWHSATPDSLAFDPRISVATNGMLEAFVLTALNLAK